MDSWSERGGAGITCGRIPERRHGRQDVLAVGATRTSSQVAFFSYRDTIVPVVRTAKISIAVDKEDLRLARKAAKSEGLSLSAYIARALANQLEEQRRIDAARALYEDWGPASVPSRNEREAFLARMSRRSKRRPKAA